MYHVYIIINKTGELWESIKSWNCLPTIHKTWIAYKTHLLKTYLEFTKTGELTLEQAGYGQANLI